MAMKSGATSEADLLEQQRLASLEVAGPHIDGYEIQRKIGQGTYGDVWEALDSNTRVIVAIKRLRKLPSGKSVEDCDLLAKLSEAPGIVRLHKLHLEDEPYCFAMEYMRGGSLADLLKDGPLPFEEAWHMFREIVRGTAYIHKHDLVHCDLKPANILLDSRGEPRIGDFGQARKAGSGGASYGTQFYMPPEQAREGRPTKSWDVYALGAILYEMLTGKRPFFNAEISERMSASARSGSNIRDRQELYARHMEESDVPTEHRRVKGVDANVSSLIDRCLDTSAEERPTDAEEVLKLIKECDRAKRSRPLWIFGALAPALAMLTLAIGMIIFHVATWQRFEDAWLNHIKGGNAAVAEAITNAIELSFKQRMRIMREAASDQEVRLLLEKGPTVGDPEIEGAVKRLYEISKSDIPRMTLANADGTCLYTFGLVDGEEGDDSETIGKNFAWRGWFNAKFDREHVEETLTEGQPAAPMDLEDFRKRRSNQPFVSQPYRRKGKHDTLAISVSCPIAEDDDSEPIGVLGGVCEYNDFVRDVKAFVSTKAAEELTVLIVNVHNQVIFSPHLDDFVVQDEATVDSAPFSVPHLTEWVLFDDEQQFVKPEEAYLDPLDPEQGLCLGSPAIANLSLDVSDRNTVDDEDTAQKLAVLVYVNKSKAMQPIRKLKLANWFAIAAILACAIGYLVFIGIAIRRMLRSEALLEVPASV